MTRKLLLVVVPLMLLVLVLTQATSARMFRNFFEPEGAATGQISHGGRFVEVDARIECTEGERVSVEVILSQGSEEFEELDPDFPNALGRGHAFANCDGEGALQSIPVRVVAHGRERFVEGPATGTGIAVTTYRGQRTDVRQWQPDAGVELHE